MWHSQLSSLFVLALVLLFGHCEGYSLVVTPDVVVVQEKMDHVWLTCSKETEGGHEENLESPPCHVCLGLPINVIIPMFRPVGRLGALFV